MYAKYFRLCIFISLSLICFSPASFAELLDLPLDFYVRHSDLIVEGDVESKFEKDDLKFAKIKIEHVYYGTAANQINIISYEGPYKGKPVGEDAPFYLAGEKGVFFLRNKILHGENALFPSDFEYYDTVYGMGGKVTDVDVKTRFPKNKSGFIHALERIVGVKKEVDDSKKIARLIELLDSGDFNIIRAANSYLDYLINGADYEKLKIKYSENERWEEYLKKNADYSRMQWKKWWHEKDINIQKVR